MIPQLHRASSTSNVLTYLYGPGWGGNHTDPRLIAGDVHGASIEQLAGPDSLPDVAQALREPVERLGASAPKRQAWICSVRSDPGRPDLADSQWAAVARRLVAAAGVAPEGDPDACRWVAVRIQPRQMYVVATLVREDGSLHNAYSDAFRLKRECHVLSGEMGHQITDSYPKLSDEETPVAAPPITITHEFSGSVVAKGANDDLSARLLKHAGFQQTEDWYGRRHRLPTTTPVTHKVAIATHAAEMLRAAHYTVDLSPSLDTARKSPPAHPLGPYAAGAELLQVTERIRAAENGDALERAVDHLLHPEYGALEGVREALEAAGEHINDLDDEAYKLADRFGLAADLVSSAQSELVSSAQSELVSLDAELRRVRPGQQPRIETRTRSPKLPDSRGAALATSPAAAKAKVSSTLGAGTAGSSPAARPSPVPEPRTR
ncbi:hypothetical protein [Streptomyces tubercidicus]